MPNSSANFSPLSFISIQIFDASTNKWKLVDEKQHTDVYERIVENPIEDDTPIYRRNITDETNIINNLERNMLRENLDERHTKTTDSVDYIRSDHLIDESKSSSDLVNQIMIKEDVHSRKDSKVSIIIVLLRKYNKISLLLFRNEPIKLTSVKQRMFTKNSAFVKCALAGNFHMKTKIFSITEKLYFYF